MNYARRRRHSIRRKKVPAALKRLAVLTLSFAVLRTFFSLGGEQLLEALLSDTQRSERAAQVLLAGSTEPEDPVRVLYSIAMSTLPVGQLTANESALSPADTAGIPDAAAVPGETPAVNTPAPAETPALPITLPDNGVSIDWTEHLDASGIRIQNESIYEIDTDALLNSPPVLSFSAEGPTVLIVHTHGSEAYTPDAEHPYTETDPWRTEDTDFNVVHVGDVLTTLLESAGINVIHDRTLNDFPSYDGSYSRALTVIEGYLAEYPSICMVIDLHRDAVQSADGSALRTAANIGGTECSQIMLVMGTDSTGLDHPNWQENMKLALRLQYAMNVMYPSLTKPINLSEYRYNMHATPGSMIIEVGGIGNTLDESITAVTYFADAAIEVLSTLGAC